MRAEGCVALMRGLLQNHCLSSLDLSYHGIRNAGCMALCEAIRQPTSALKYLCLQKNHIQARGAMHMATCIETMVHAYVTAATETIPMHKPYLVFDLSWNGIDAIGQNHLLQAMQQATTTFSTAPAAAQQPLSKPASRSRATRNAAARNSTDESVDEQKGTSSTTTATTASSSSSSSSSSTVPSFFRTDVLPNASVWVCPAARIPAFALSSSRHHLSPSWCHALAAVGCTIPVQQMVQVLLNDQQIQEAEPNTTTTTTTEADYEYEAA